MSSVNHFMIVAVDKTTKTATVEEVSLEVVLFSSKDHFALLCNTSSTYSFANQ